MNRQDLEHRLRQDAGALSASCPPHVGQRVAARIRAGEARPARPHFGFPALAGAMGALAVFASVWLLWPQAGVESPEPRTAGLNAVPVVATSDRMLASREAALESELQLLGRDLRILRDHVTATLDNS